MIVGSVDIFVQTSRLRDGSRRITHITEVESLQGEIISTQDLITFETYGETASGKIRGRHVSSGIARPKFWDRAVYFGLAERLTAALIEAGAPNYQPDEVELGERKAI